MNTFTQTYHGLKGWQWIAAIGLGGYLFFRMRGGGSSTGGNDPLATDTSGDVATQAGSEGFQQGYGQGYGAGIYQGQISPVVNQPKPPPGSMNCRPMKDPSGKSHIVCGPGAWENLLHPGQTPVWHWVQGLQHTIYATGKHGTVFRRPPPVKAHKPGAKASVLNNVSIMGGTTPVKEWPNNA